MPETPSDLTDIQKTLNDIGVHYIHRNEDILVPSKIRVQQNKAMLSVRRELARDVTPNQPLRRNRVERGSGLRPAKGLDEKENRLRQHGPPFDLIISGKNWLLKKLQPQIRLMIE